MKLIEDIINELINSKESLTSPLLKTKVLASRIKSLELGNWVDRELTGYSENDNMPDYRKCSGIVFGSFINGRTFKAENVAISISGLSKSIQERFTCMDFRQGVSVLEELVVNTDGSVHATFSGEYITILSRHIQSQGNPYFNLYNAETRASAGSATQVLSTIRSKLLDFMLKIEEQFGATSDIASLKNKTETINNIFQTVISNSGDGNIVNTGNNSSLQKNNS